jgi:quercetin dioxygenase-like cupin family protein
MSSSAEAQSHPGTGTHAWNRRARFFNSGNAFALDLSPVPSVSFIAARDQAFHPAAPSGLIDMDLSAALNLPFPATPPLVLSHQALAHTRNIHPTMTLALNSLPAGRSQRAHVHNAMALTLCLDGEGCHSLVDGERKDWSRYAVMVTPPGAAHSHHNAGSTRMESWVVQDGGLHYHARTTGFAYAD